MPYTTIEDLCGSGWGILTQRRQEIERGTFGIFSKVFAEELNAQFPTAGLSAVIMGCSNATARFWLNNDSVHFIFYEDVIRFWRQDVVRIRDIRNKRIRKLQEKKAAKVARKKVSAAI